MVKVAVLGAGSWGTTLAKVFADAGNQVALWARRDAVARTIQQTRENPEYLPGIVIPEAVEATSDAAEALGGAAIAVFGVALISASALALNLLLPGGNAWRRHPPIDPEI